MPEDLYVPTCSCGRKLSLCTAVGGPRVEERITVWCPRCWDQAKGISFADAIARYRRLQLEVPNDPAAAQ